MNEAAVEDMIGERIRARRKELNLKQPELGKIVGISGAAISQLERGDSKNPSSENLLKLAKALKCSPEWLQTGRGSTTGASAEEIGRYTVTRSARIPMYTAELAAGIGTHIDMDAVSEFFEVGQEVLEQHNLKETSVVAARVRGDSMSPRLLDGDIVLIDTSERRPRDRQVYAIAVGEGEYADLKVKRLVHNLDGSWTISSDNKDDPDYRDQTISTHNFQELRVIGKVVMILMGGI